jgi:hypothetical protein
MYGMKRKLLLTAVLTALLFSGGFAEDKKGSVNVGTDVVSSYLWRGTKFGNGSAFQPTLEYSYGGFAIGAWGSYGFADAAFSEADLYASYSFDFGLSLGMTKYYFPGVSFFEGSNHGFELNGGIEAGAFSLAANYMLNEGAGTIGGDTYIEAGVTTGPVYWFVGAGNGWYTVDTKFGLCNVGLTGSKEIKITDSFSLPVFSSIILNPSNEQFHLVVGFSL